MGGWDPVTVTNWLHLNNLKYEQIHKFIHPTICPAMAVDWKTKGFSPLEARQWASIQIQIDLAVSLRDLKIHPSMINKFLSSGYTWTKLLNTQLRNTQ
ncbi:hypothetical protein DSO57_1022538 [Entomophthora muscae]|uniref:Uncharacterized protein n=1 Tax=Entomophthora muscae TaxID=34485 RepID=A0ACC2TQ04_9FUNG|nr:hypothetical protein DSO57_1022538 [Entomophthora muscae]